jgi:hypothetical protein
LWLLRIGVKCSEPTPCVWIWPRFRIARHRRDGHNQYLILPFRYFHYYDLYYKLISLFKICPHLFPCTWTDGRRCECACAPPASTV